MFVAGGDFELEGTLALGIAFDGDVWSGLGGDNRDRMGDDWEWVDPFGVGYSSICVAKKGD
jgi:hypothetical protein